MDNFWDSYGEKVRIFEAELENRFGNLDDIPDTLLSAMKYSLFAGGKRLRPVLLLASCELFGGDYKQGVSLAMAVELIHTYSLIHDDLPAMDNDDLRRGRATNHKMFGEDMAILAGDALLNLAYEIMLRMAVSAGEVGRYLAAAAEIAESAGARGMIKGQVLDMSGQKQSAADAAQAVREMHAHKTGKLLTAPLVAGALLGGAPEEELAAIRRFGEALGIAFQIQDDLMDVLGSEEDTGKPRGSDERNDKLTYVKVYGAPGAEREMKLATKRALDALEPFGTRAAFLRELAAALMERRS